MKHMPGLQMCRLSNMGSAENPKEQAMITLEMNLTTFICIDDKIEHTSSIIDLTPGRIVMP